MAYYTFSNARLEARGFPLSDSSIRMKVSALSVDPLSSAPVILLTDDSSRMLPIKVGLGEVSAVAAELGCIEFERPNTHRLMAALLQRAGATVDRVEIYDVSGDLLYARIHLVLATGEAVVEESRPSDALILALLAGAEIRVASRVLDRAGHTVDDEHDDMDWSSGHSGAADVELPEFSDDTFGKWKM